MNGKTIKKEYIPVGIVKEFKEFAVKGNVIDMAVGIIIGAAFGKILQGMPRFTKFRSRSRISDYDL